MLEKRSELNQFCLVCAKRRVKTIYANQHQITVDWLAFRTNYITIQEVALPKNNYRLQLQDWPRRKLTTKCSTRVALSKNECCNVHSPSGMFKELTPGQRQGIVAKLHKGPKCGRQDAGMNQRYRRPDRHDSRQHHSTSCESCFQPPRDNQHLRKSRMRDRLCSRAI